MRLRVDCGSAQQPPCTVHQMFCRTLEKYGGLRALGFKRQGVWEHISYSQYYLLARRAAKGFLKVRALPGPLPNPPPGDPGTEGLVFAEPSSGARHLMGAFHLGSPSSGLGASCWAERPTPWEGPGRDSRGC